MINPIKYAGSMIKGKGSTASKMLWENKGNAIATGIFSTMTYNSALDEGKSKGEAFGEAAFDATLNLGFGFIPGMLLQAAYYGGPALVGLANDLAAQGRQEAQQSYRPFAWTNPVNSQQYATMRQAGMAIAQQSQYSLQTTMMGNEGKAFHK